MTCLRCAIPLPKGGGRGRPRVYCSTACKRYRTRSCQGCHRLIPVGSRASKFCSPQCRDMVAEAYLSDPGMRRRSLSGAASSSGEVRMESPSGARLDSVGFRLAVAGLDRGSWLHEGPLPRLPLGAPDGGHDVDPRVEGWDHEVFVAECGLRGADCGQTFPAVGVTVGAGL